MIEPEDRRTDRRDRLRDWLLVLGLACLAASRVILAAPALQGSRPCEVTSPQEAKSLADALFEKRQYQRAGECYEAAGDPSHAQLAFAKAVGPKGEASARRLRGQGDAAKTLLTHVQQAFRSDH
jgi:hypothetical protein